MVQKVFAIRDAKAENYFNPFYAPTAGEAERNFTAVAMDPKSTICQFPEDFDLFYLGEYDTNSGILKPLTTPQHVIKALNVKRPQN